MGELLEHFAKGLRKSLKDCFPQLSEDWWTRYVISSLTFHQAERVKQSGISTLDGLDLAALLRVIDQNWFELSSKFDWPKDARIWLKETQNIRNRWAHLPSEGLDDETQYRDLDTIERLQLALDGNSEILSTLREHKQMIMARISGASAKSVVTPSVAANAGEYVPGTVVRLKAQPTITGAVVACVTGNPENRYQVFQDGSVTTYYESQIELANSPAAPETVSSKALHAALTALQLRHPSTSFLYSLFASRINFVPYQFRPVLKLIQADRPRLLIADEVGVGKTIEAGLILKELQARRDIRSVLVICPKPLVTERKWLEEMRRFDEQFVHLDGNALRYCIDETDLDGIWPQQYNRAILPYSLLDETLLLGKSKGNRKQLGLLDLDPPPAFDLVIIDEAHHIRNTDTWAYRNARYFCDNAEAVVLLSATPIQLRDNDLYTLLHLLRPDVLPSRQAFEQMSAPNKHINNAIESVRLAQPNWKTEARSEIERAINTDWGRGVLVTNPIVQELCDKLNSGDDNTTEKRLKLIHQLEDVYTFSSLINRTRRRDIGSFTTRKPETVSVKFTPEQESLHSDLIDLISRILVQRHGDQNLMFMLTTIRRQLASCVFGLAPLLDAILSRHLTKLELSEIGDGELVDNEEESLADFKNDVEKLIDSAKNLTGEDPKYDAFLKVVSDKQKLPKNKLLVFSTFRHTLAYLVTKLSNEPVRIGLIHGGIKDEDRRELRQRFSLPKEDSKAIDILLSSEVGCEGLDFQFCDGMVNYDLPWNPMRVEQRIGRIDRYGQKSESVVIYNLITPGTVDAEIYERCLLRIGVFRQALGGSEEVLGKLTREIHDIAERQILTPGELANKLQQLAENEIRDIQEQEKLEEAQNNLFGLSLPARDEELVKQASSFWLAPGMLVNLVERYLETLESGKAPYSLALKPINTLQIGQKTREKLLTDFEMTNLTGAAAQAWQHWLKGNDPYITITFEADIAADRRDVVFITPVHPLARQAARAAEPISPLIGNLIASEYGMPQGRYPFAIYRWRKFGIKEDFTFQPVCADPVIAERMLELLETASQGNESQPITKKEEDSLELLHHQLWNSARADHIEQVGQAAQARLASLKTTHAARITLLEEQRDIASDIRIRRMRNGQVEAANRDYTHREVELQKAAEQVDIIAEAVAFGTLTVANAVIG